MTDELLKAYEASIESLELVPSSGGVFEVDVNGDLIYSKKATGRHAGTGEILNLVSGLANPSPPPPAIEAGRRQDYRV